MVEYVFEPVAFLRTQAWSWYLVGHIGCITHKNYVTDEPLIFPVSFEITLLTGPRGNTSLKKHKATFKPNS